MSSKTKLFLTKTGSYDKPKLIVLQKILLLIIIQIKIKSINASNPATVPTEKYESGYPAPSGLSGA